VGHREAGERVRLGEFIEQNVEAILVEWEAFARGIWPPGTPVDPSEMRDHAEMILRAVVADMAAAQTGDERAAKSRGEPRPSAHADALDDASDQHGATRVGSAFRLRQVLAEYRALRASVLRLHRQSRPDPDPEDLEDLGRFHESIDQSLARAVDSFTDRTEQARRVVLAVLGQDLRGPLNAIRSRGRSLAGPGRAADVAEAGRDVVADADTMDRMIADLLALTAAAARGPVAAGGGSTAEWDAAKLRQMLSVLIVNAASDFAMLMLDPAGRIVAWNAGAERVLGYTEAEVIGRDGSIIFTPEDVAAGEAAKEQETAARDGRAQDERWHVRKGGERFWGSGVLNALRESDGTVRGYVKVLRDETARKRAEDALVAATEAAEAASRAKDEFLATISHELRTPMSAVLLWAKLLRSGALPEAQRPEALAAIETGTEAQGRLIDDLLDSARITSGKLRLEMRDVDLRELVRSSVETILPTAENKGVVVAANLSADAGVGRVDPERLRQVVWNLLTNAVKFTPTGGRVDVALVRRGREVEVRVTDTGHGIDAMLLPHVFEPFRQGEQTASNRTVGGLGLGLSITKRLVELHGGSIAAVSDGPGRGATFTVRLPLAAVRGKPGASGAVDASAGGDPLKGCRVLLVEDEPSTRAAVKAALQSQGAVVTEAGSAPAGFDAYRKARPDLIVSDIGLPGEDGYSLIRRIRALEAEGGKANPRVPAIAVTAFVRPEARARAIEAGFQDQLGKPVDPEMLFSSLRRAANIR